MAIIVSNNGRTSYGIKRLVVRTVEELLNIPVAPTSIKPGSTVFVTTTQTRYMLDPDYNWIQLGAGGSEDPEPTAIIYEGGNIEHGVEENPEAEYEGGTV